MSHVAIVGCGRMGQAIEAEATRREHVVVARIASTEEIDRERLSTAQVAFEFTVPEAAEANVRALLGAGVSVVSGTTGWQVPADLDALAKDQGAAVVVAPNFSLGVQLYYRIVERAAQVFAAAGLHQPFIEEFHHRGKRDAPSGTARRLGEIVVRNDPRVESIHVDNPSGILPDNVLPIASVRAGAEPGTHVVGYDGDHDRVTLRHSARGRTGFALGAVLAAEWIAGRQGLVTFEELVDRFLQGKAAGKET